MNIVLLPALFALASAAAPAPVDTFVLAVGVNDAGVPGLSPLRYADDDAAEAVRLTAAGRWDRARLLTVMDPATQQEAPDLAPLAQVPSVPELLRAVRELRGLVDESRAAGHRTAVHIWLSGHARYDDDGHAVLPLSDGSISVHRLFTDVIEPLAVAHRVHVFVDTCFAGALVRAKAAVKSAEPETAEAVFLAQDLRRLPNVGAFVAASAKSAAYEWEEVRAGVFSALVRAGLRGAADADRDDVIRYSELSAFLAASTDAVAVQTARPQLAVYPPAIERDAEVLVPKKTPGHVLLDEDLAALGPVSIVDGRGVFLVAAAFETGFRPRLWLPAGRGLYLRARGEERPLTHEAGRLTIGAGQELDVKARSLVSRALSEGLFKTPFGPAFYRGYRVTALRPVDVAGPAATAGAEGAGSALVPTVLLSVAGGAAVVGAGAAAVTGYFAVQLATTPTERGAYQAFAGVGAAAGVTAGALVVATVTAASGALVLVLE